MEKICWQITVAAFMQPLQYDLRSPAAKDNSITNAATAGSNLDAAITMRSAETELQSTIELRATASEIVAPKPDLDARAEKIDFWSVFIKNWNRKWKQAKSERIQLQQVHAAITMALRPQLVHRSMWNLLDITGTILQLQSTMEFHRQLLHQHHL